MAIIETVLAGWDRKTPLHFSQIEAVSHRLAAHWGCCFQEWAAREIDGGERLIRAACPTCGEVCSLGARRPARSCRRMVPCRSWNGKGLAPAVGGIFFPQREAMGLDSRELTPAMVQRIVHAASETRSSKRAALVLKHVGGNEVSPSTVQRVTHQVGMELAELRDAGAAPALAHAPENPPELAVVEADGGRIRTRKPGQGRGVHGEAWRETKNANLLRMTHRTFAEDPEPELPRAFTDPKRVAKLAEKEAPPEILVLPASPPREKAWRPERLVRTCLSSMAEADTFGQQMKRETDRRRFAEASARAFVGDGLAWNWSVWKHYFPEFVPILDFIHALSYLYAAALAMHPEFSVAWSCYLRMARATWQGHGAQAMDELSRWLTPHGLDDKAKLEENDPRKPIVDAAQLPAEQPKSDGLSALPTSGAAGNIGPDGIPGQGGEPPGERDRDVLERSGWGRGDPASPCRRPLRRRPLDPLPIHPPGLCLCPSLDRHRCRLNWPEADLHPMENGWLHGATE